MDKVLAEMLDFFEGDPKRISHLVKVHAFAAYIGRHEGLDERTLDILEAAAYVHDAGIKEAERLYGFNDGKLQERYGPKAAEEILRRAGADGELIERVKYLVGRHHTYVNIDGLDLRILIEADFLVNLFEDNASEEAAKNALDKIFKTKTGTDILKKMYISG